MRKLLRFSWLLGGLGWAAISGSGEMLRIRADEWMPYNGNPKAEHPGYAIDVLREIFTPLGIQIEYQSMPWGDALKAAKDGEIEAVVGANTREGAGLVLPVQEIGNPRVGLFVRKGSTWVYENPLSFKKIHLGAIRDYKYWDTLDDYILKHDAPLVTKFSGNTPLNDAVAQLDAGLIDVMPETYTVFMWFVRNSGRKVANYQYVYLDAGDPVYVAFKPNPDGRHYAAVFNAGLEKLRKSGRLSQILVRYGLTDWR
jgi:polar amino acid transport system substrate-binding protein